MSRQFSSSPSRASLHSNGLPAPQHQLKRTPSRQELGFPGALAPSAVINPQASLSQHSFAALRGGAVVSLTGGCCVESSSDGSQVVRCSPRCRHLGCCALSPCERFLAVAEVAGAGRSPQVLVFDRIACAPGRSASAILSGHRHAVKILAWCSQGSMLISLGQAESDQAGDHQLLIWSWPQAERLVVISCPRGVLGLAVAPDFPAFATVSGTSAARWDVQRQMQDPFLPLRGTAQAAEVLSTPIPADLLCCSRSASCAYFTSAGVSRCCESPASVSVASSSPVQASSSASRPSSSSSTGGDRWKPPALAAVAWGSDGHIFFASPKGFVFALSWITRGAPPQLNCRQVLDGTPTDLSWSRSFGSFRPEGGLGLLAVAMADGTMRLLEAGSLVPLATCSPASPRQSPGEPACFHAHQAIGLRWAPDGHALWVLYSDRSLVRFRGPRATEALASGSSLAEWSLQAPSDSFRDVQDVPTGCLPQALTSTGTHLQLWTASPVGALRPGPSLGPISEVSALAVSPWLVASGHCSGDLNLLALPGLLALEQPMPVRHACRVHALAFAPWRPASGTPLLLASAALDAIFLFRVDMRRGVFAMEASGATLLLRLPGQVAPRHLALSLMQELRLCTSPAEGKLLAYTIDLGSASVRGIFEKQISDGSTWVGLCAAETWPALLAASSDGWLHQVAGGSDKSQVRKHFQQLFRVPGDLEVVGPLRCSDGGSSVVLGTLSHGNFSILLLRVQQHSMSLHIAARLVGHQDICTGVTFLGSSVLGCWPDGSMLLWSVDQADPDVKPNAERQEEQKGRTRSCQPQHLLSPSRVLSPPGRSKAEAPAKLADGQQALHCPMQRHDRFVQRLISSVPTASSILGRGQRDDKREDNWASRKPREPPAAVQPRLKMNLSSAASRHGPLPVQAAIPRPKASAVRPRGFLSARVPPTSGRSAVDLRIRVAGSPEKPSNKAPVKEATPGPIQRPGIKPGTMRRCASESPSQFLGRPLPTRPSSSSPPRDNPKGIEACGDEEIRSHGCSLYRRPSLPPKPSIPPPEGLLDAVVLAGRRLSGAQDLGRTGKERGLAEEPSATPREVLAVATPCRGGPQSTETFRHEVRRLCSDADRLAFPVEVAELLRQVLRQVE